MPKHFKKNRGKSTAVPYAKGFRVPSKQQQLKAIGFAEDIPIPKAYFPAENVFNPIPKCTSIDDWLAQYKEDGQTYNQFLDECPWLSSRKIKSIKQSFNKTGKTAVAKYPNGKIYIVPVGEFDQKSCPKLDDLVEYTRIFLQFPVETLPPLEIQVQEKQVYLVQQELNNTKNTEHQRQRPKRKQILETRFHDKKYQIKVSGKSPLLFMRNFIPDDALCVIALTMSDLYDDESDLFVAGMAAGNHRVAIFSLYRYDPYLTFSTEHWFSSTYTEAKFEKPDHPNNQRKQIILQRGCRLLVHEISHLLGFAHCIYFSCCMNGSGHLEEDFSQPMTLCPVDLRKVQTLAGFSVIQRYKQLMEFCEQHGFQERNWYNERIQAIESENGTS